jgi:N-ethylmaleimide reductase
MPSLFDPIQLGDIALANRIVMAPLTRNRAIAGQVPSPLAPLYYRQRADPATGAGLIVSEASQISPQGRGYADTPGIHSAEQAAGWRPVTRAVHEVGGRIVLQLWHVGRVSHTSLQPGGAQPVSSSARIASSRVITPEGIQPCSPPRALRTEELPGIVADYRRAAALAMDCGFDGVEVHGANGYLLDQFLRDTLNDRNDEYGGSIPHRARLLLEVVQGVAAEIGAGRTGLRLSPASPLGDVGPDSQAQALFEHVMDALAPLGLAFLHMIEGQTGGARDAATDGGIAALDYATLRRRFGGPWMVNNGYTRSMAIDAVASGAADCVAFGKPFIPNPDLGRRLRENLPWAEADRNLYYRSPDEDPAAGYTSYPAFDAATV